ncbi:hypothetical protein ACJ8L9_01615 [Lacticaseibacillus rhamnosus]|uniref:hypothetical protein n=1 Tax=Lacticaseibacillus rhamnosus TaxID=47715 RepID=UPI003B9AF930
MIDKQNEAGTSNGNKLNGFTIAAIVMAAVGFVLNPFALLSILAIIFGSVAIVKAQNVRDKKWAIIATGVSTMETLFWVAIVYSTLAAL